MIEKLSTVLHHVQDEGQPFKRDRLPLARVLVDRLNEIIDVVNAMQRDTVVLQGDPERVPVYFSQAPPYDRIFQARQQEYAKSVHAQTFGLGDPEE